MFGVDTVIYIMLIAAIVAAAASAYMQYEAGQQQQKAAKYNQKLLERQADLQKQAAGARADDIRQRNKVMLATMEARGAASGVTQGEGTSLLATMAYSAREGELDALRAEWYGDAQAEATTAESRLARYKGDVAAYTGTMQAGSTLLSGVSSSARMYYGATANG